jgi:hypothetical protein
MRWHDPRNQGLARSHRREGNDGSVALGKESHQVPVLPFLHKSLRSPLMPARNERSPGAGLPMNSLV